MPADAWDRGGFSDAERSLLADARNLTILPPEYAALAEIDGWVLWLGHPPAPEGTHPLPVGPELLWGDPGMAVAAAVEIAVDYARRRGADDAPGVRSLLRRESPVTIVVPDTVSSSLRARVQTAENLGIPVVLRPPDVAAISRLSPPMQARVMAHGVLLGLPHDPALSFQQPDIQTRIGGNSLSSFVLHNEPERDGVTITGERSARFGLEIGVSGDQVTLESTAAIEREALAIPAFLDGVSSGMVGHALEIGWGAGTGPSAETVAALFDVWLRALWRIETVDLRLVFAPPQGRSAVLTDMRARAAEFKRYRDAVLAGDPDPLAMAEGTDG